MTSYLLPCAVNTQMEDFLLIVNVTWTQQAANENAINLVPASDIFMKLAPINVTYFHLLIIVLAMTGHNSTETLPLQVAN